MAPAHPRKLPPLSNANLSAFETCQKQYELRYLSELGWPLIPVGDAVASEEAERLGQLFHLAVEQRSHGQDVTALLDESPKLHAWWLRFMQKRFHDPAGTVWHEARLLLPYAGERVLAVMDRLQCHDGQWTIWDWKTGRRFERESLARSAQTLLYPFALAEAGHIYNGGQAIPPEAIRMVYWSAEHDRQEIFTYDAAAFATAGERIRATIAALHTAREAGFGMTGKPKACHAKGRPCAFVPLCLGAGASQTTDEAWESEDVPALVADDDPFV
jgi:hypothetical protein